MKNKYGGDADYEGDCPHWDIPCSWVETW